MHVAQLLQPFFRGPDIEVVEAGLPERTPLLFAEHLALAWIATSSFWQQSMRRALLQHLHHGGGGSYLRFVNQNMYVLWRDDIADDNQAVALPGLLQGSREPGLVPERFRVELGADSTNK